MKFKIQIKIFITDNVGSKYLLRHIPIIVLSTFFIVKVNLITIDKHVKILGKKKDTFNVLFHESH